MNREKALETIIVLALALTIAFLIFNATWLLIIAIGLLIVSLLLKSVTIFIGSLWFKFSHYLGFFMNYVIMFVIFFLVLVPISFFQKLFGKNQILNNKRGNSFFVFRNHLFTKDDIQKPW